MAAPSTVSTKLLDTDAPHLRSAHVLRISIYGFPVVPGNPTSVLHWRVYAKTEQRSVVFDLMPGGGPDGLSGVLFLAPADDAATQESVGRYHYDLTRAITVQDLLDLLLQNGRDKYRYDASGSGCRYWTRMVVGDLERAGIIANGSEALFSEYIAELNARMPECVPMPERQGEFYGVL